MVRRIVHQRSSRQDVSLARLYCAACQNIVNGTQIFLSFAGGVFVRSLLYCERLTLKDLAKERQTEISCNEYPNMKS